LSEKKDREKGKSIWKGGGGAPRSSAWSDGKYKWQEVFSQKLDMNVRGGQAITSTTDVPLNIRLEG